jgi:hypothetical protein
MNRVDKIIITSWGLWSCLGMYRGNRFYINDNKRQKKYSSEVEYYYTTNIGFSIAGGVMYAFPIFMPVTIINELYNLEETIRGFKSHD